MNNLPMSGSTQWGASLNNYLRLLNTKITNLESQMSAITTSVAYEGSGLVDGTYNLTIKNTSSTDVSNINIPYIFGIDGHTTLNISLHAIFLKNGENGYIKDFVLSDTQGYYVDFGILKNGSNMTSKTIPVKKSIVDSNSKITTTFRSNDLTIDLPNDGYYPVYLTLENGNPVLTISYTEGFIHNPLFIMIGLIYIKHTSQEDPLTRKVFFIKKSDSAFKSAYETKQSNTEAMAMIVPDNTTKNNGLFTITDTGIVAKVGELNIGYISNGINPNFKTTTTIDPSTGAIASISTYPSDYFIFQGSSEKNSYLVTSNLNDTHDHYLTSFTPLTQGNLEFINNDTNSTNNLFSQANIYGIFISASGDILVESRADTDINKIIWNLPTLSTCKTGGIVLLGVAYCKNHIWYFTQPAVNGIPPALFSCIHTEDLYSYNLPNNTYTGTASLNNEGEVVSSNSDAIYNYSFNVINNSRTDKKESNTGQLYYNFIFDDRNAKEKKSSKIGFIPCLTQNFIKPWINTSAEDGEKNLIGFTVGNIALSDTAGEGVNNPIVIGSDGILHSNIALISSNINKDHSFTEQETVTNRIRDLVLRGTITFDKATTINIIDNIFKIPTLQVDTITTNTTTNNSIVLSKSIDCVGSQITIGATANNTGALILSSGSVSGETTSTSTISSYGINIAASNNLNIETPNIAIKTTGNISIDGKITFTSDERCKHNIQPLNSAECLNAVKNINATHYIYNNNNQSSIGLIAQDIEKYLPSYSQELVSILNKDGLIDKREVTEGKIVFILWQAVKELINKMEDFK